MKVAVRDLPLHLNRGLASCYFIVGEEPLQRKESIDAIRLEAKKQGFTEREQFDIHPQFQWDIVFNAISSPSLFASKRLIECHITVEKINAETIAGLTELASRLPNPETIFLLSAPKIDYALRNSKWFTALDAKGVTLMAQNLSPAETRMWIEKRLQSLDFIATPEVIETLLQRTEGNLFAAAQTLEKLHLCGASKTLTVPDILNTVGKEARFGLFDLTDALLAGETARTTQIFYGLQSEGVDPILIAWAIAREIRLLIAIHQKIQQGVPLATACSTLGIWKQRELLFKSCINRIAHPILLKMLTTIKHVDDIIKGRALGNAWNQLFSICLTFTQQELSLEILSS